MAKKSGSSNAWVAPVVVLATAGIVFAGYANTGTTLQKLTYSLEGVQFLKSEGFLLNSKISLDLGINNPNRQDVLFKEFKGKITADGKLISAVDIKKNLKLEGEDKTILKGIKFKMSNLNILDDILKAANGEKPKTFKLEGLIWAGGFRYPVDEDFKL